ncbi:hypothetical protein F4804DRAFT_314278 [Jackrogersella minutella]|nr:hypothetical protein F4804DRAFT_314278 [Jackrogersella minutella]
MVHHYDPDTSDHHQVHGSIPFSCAECGASFPNKTRLERHAYDDRHNAVACSCGKRFSRLDSLNRHLDSFRKDIRRFSCPRCKRYRGNNGFRRRDHLIQHLSGYHKIAWQEIQKAFSIREKEYAFEECDCPAPMCEFHLGANFQCLSWIEREVQAPFKTKSQFNKHLKEAHEVTPCPCPVAECKRTGAKGYMTVHGLEKHLIREHTKFPQHLAKCHELRMQNRECDNCGENIGGHRGYLNLHRQLAHQITPE